MADVRLERDFDVSVETLYRFVTGSQELVQWFGPEGVTVPENDLDFTRTGPWYAVMVNVDGHVAKVSGQVTHVDPPHSVGFTWAWHDEDDQRDAESHVTLTVAPTESGARLMVDHRDLTQAEVAESHREGWNSSLACLAKVVR